jgi:hypothetical protein
MNMDKHGLFGRRWRRRIAIGLLCFPIVYTLSTGPMAKLDDCGIIGERADKILDVFYAPLQGLAQVPGARQFFRWYIFQVWKCDTMGDNTI